MPKETLIALDRDAERLLFAGASLARADSDLGARRDKLRAFAAKAPAIAKVVEQVEKTQKASGKAAPTELCNLTAMMAQVRGAQAAPAPAPGDLAPLPATDPVESPLSPTELSTLVNALTVSGKARARIVSDAVQRGAVRDLRLLPFCVKAVGDPAVGHVVAHELLPSLGHIVVPELRATLRIEKGTQIDGRKLGVLVMIQNEEAKPLLLQAAEKGSPEMRRAALTMLGEMDPALAEGLSLKALAEDRSVEVRRAAITALGGATSDEALEALLTAFVKSDDLRYLAGYSLARLTHPRTTERALALLTPELTGLTNLKLPKADTPAKKKANEKLEREHSAKVGFLGSVLDLLASRKDNPETVEKVLAVFRGHKIKEAKNAAALALLKSGYDKAFDELAPSVYDADWDTRDGFIEGILEHDKAHAFERLGRFLDPSALKTKNHVAFAEHILDTLGVKQSGERDDAEEKDDQPEAQPLPILEQDPRWTDATIALLGHKDLKEGALGVLSTIRSDKAKEAILTFAAAKMKSESTWVLLNALEGYKDPRVPPLLLACLDATTSTWDRRQVYRTLRGYDDPVLGAGIKAWAAGKKKLDKREKEEIEDLVQFLERDRNLTKGV